jgi:transcriptional regulator with XRE-family HTH domain
MNTKPKKTQSTAYIKEVVGVQVRRLRVEAKMSQQELAERWDIFRTYLSRIENGIANHTITVMVAPAAALKVEIAGLFKE